MVTVTCPPGAIQAIVSPARVDRGDRPVSRSAAASRRSPSGRRCPGRSGLLCLEYPRAGQLRRSHSTVPPRIACPFRTPRHGRIAQRQLSDDTGRSSSRSVRTASAGNNLRGRSRVEQGTLVAGVVHAAARAGVEDTFSTPCESMTRKNRTVKSAHWRSLSSSRSSAQSSARGRRPRGRLSAP